LSDDRESTNLANYTKLNEEDVDMYLQHMPSQAKIINCIRGLDEVVSEETEK